MIKQRLPLAAALLILTTPLHSVVIDPYAWQFPQITNISGASDLITDLQEEAQKILDAGHLAPLYLSHSDQEPVGYRMYQEPGRTITTLAWAYPYLTPAQQTATRTYVANELANSTYATWAASNLPLMTGTPRELHPKTQWWYQGSNLFDSRPRIQTIYGLWLYAYRSGDWNLIQTNWNSIKSFYTSRTGEANMYGTMGSHIAMARLADKFGDSSMRTTALSNLQSQLDSGLNFSTIENNATRTPTFNSPYRSPPDMYDTRMDGTTYRGWIFLNVVPEIGRYLANENAGLKSSVLARHNSGISLFPHWWAYQANYFNRSWMGDEGTGLTSEFIGMMAPIERWVVQANAATLRSQMKGAPIGIGDCYWLEALVQAIEAHGTLSWVDVRSSVPVDTLAPAAPRGFRMR